MPQVFRIFGSELSPYSVKVRSYFRYKQIPHEWVIRNSSNQEWFQRHAKLPLIPLVLTPEGQGLQDSTPIIEHFEALYPDPSIHPPDPTLAFLSALIEEYGDEWGNKPMFHYRWFYEADCSSAAERIARSTRPELGKDELKAAAEAIKERMVPRLKFVGSSEKTKGLIEASLERLLRILNTHLAQHPYLFGGQPAFGDFGLFAQLYECSTDPTPGALMRQSAPQVLAWTQKMLDPKVEGRWETWDTLKPTLMPILKEIGETFLPWATANAQSLEAGQKEFSLTLGGKPYSQETQKYHAKSLAVLRSRYARMADRSGLDPILEEAGCLRWLAQGTL